MDMKTLGKWAFWIALVAYVLSGILEPFGYGFLGNEYVAGLAALLAVLGGMFYLDDMDHTGFFVTALALQAFSDKVDPLFVQSLNDIVHGALGGMASAAIAGAVGVLVMILIDWLKP